MVIDQQWCDLPEEVRDCRKCIKRAEDVFAALLSRRGNALISIGLIHTVRETPWAEPESDHGCCWGFSFAVPKDGMWRCKRAWVEPLYLHDEDPEAIAERIWSRRRMDAACGEGEEQSAR